MKKYISYMDGLPFIWKLIFSFPVLNLLWGLYRSLKGIHKNNIVLLIVGIIWMFTGWWIFWVIDIITVAIYKKPTVFVN